MIIIRDPISRSFTKVDKHVFTKRGLTDGAKVLYGYFSGLPAGRTYNDGYLMKALDVSQKTLTRRKKELKDLDLILTIQLGPTVYMMFVGRLDHPASLVKSNWEQANKENDSLRAFDEPLVSKRSNCGDCGQITDNGKYCRKCNAQRVCELDNGHIG
jgi:hypothetical protein